jgi:hypothetical protein
VFDRAEDRVSPAEVHQAARLPEHPGQEEDAFVQILDQEIQAREGVPKEEILQAPAHLVSVEQDILGARHILLIKGRELRSPRPPKSSDLDGGRGSGN